MDTGDKAILSGNRVYLKDNLTVSDDLLSYLREDKILTEELEERLKKENSTKVARVNSLVDLLTKRGPKAFKGFLKSLICSGQEFVAKHLHPQYAEEILNKLQNPASNICEIVVRDKSNIYLNINNEPKFEPIINQFHELIDIREENPLFPSKGKVITPTAVNSSNIDDVGNDVVDDEIDSKLRNQRCINGEESDLNLIREGPSLLNLKICYDWSPEILSKHKCYKMRSIPRGVVLIFNISFIDGCEERTGSQFDVKNLRNLFLRLGFEVGVFENQSVKEFNEALSRKINDENLEKMDSFAIIIMTHGSDNGVLFMNDGGKVTLEEVKKQLENAHFLLEKPKLIFVQACRQGDPQPKIKCDARCKNSGKADVFVFWSTIEGERSARDPLRGSWFIRALVLVLSRHANEWQCLDVMTTVQRLVSQLQLEGHRQIALKEDTLRFCLFFCPVRVHRLVKEADSIVC